MKPLYEVSAHKTPEDWALLKHKSENEYHDWEYILHSPNKEFLLDLAKMLNQAILK